MIALRFLASTQLRNYLLGALATLCMVWMWAR